MKLKTPRYGVTSGKGLVAAHSAGRYTRLCPICGVEIIHKSFYTRNFSERKGKVCAACRNKAYPKDMSKLGGRGADNGFYGKKHTDETKAKLRSRDKAYTKTESFSARVKAGMVGKPVNRIPVYDCWVTKFGKEEANRRMAKLKARHSDNNRGTGNPMYGKATPLGSGFGWKGRIDGFFFRSLRELYYVVGVLEPNGTPWESAEKKSLEVRYVSTLGNERTYRADFLVEGKKVVECKPKRLWNAPSVLAKAEAAKKFFRNLGLEYELVDPEPLGTDKIQELVSLGRVVFQPKYAEMFKEYVDG